MKPSQSYVLVLDQEASDLQSLGLMLAQMRCSMIVVRSLEQIVETMAKVSQIPHLIILSGSQQNWSKPLVENLRTITNQSGGITIVALTDSHAPSWLRQEDNPGLDGFFVKPLNGEVLTSLVQSAWVRQMLHSAFQRC